MHVKSVTVRVKAVPKSTTILAPLKSCQAATALQSRSVPSSCVDPFGKCTGRGPDKDKAEDKI